jgi:uncharacterized damage-inducible protein DinB
VLVSAEVVRMHFDYSMWASRRLLDAAAQLTSEELTRDFGTADKSVHGTLVHIFGADRIWLARVEGRQLDALVKPADYDLAKLTREWTSLGDRWKEWAALLTDDLLNEWRDYKDMKENPHRTPLWQISLHVVNHATHHRGQVSGFLRSLGKTPPPLDLIYYYRTKSTA